MTSKVKLTELVRSGDFPKRIHNVLWGYFNYGDLFTYEQVLMVPIEEWALLPNLGRKSLAELDRIIEEKTGHRLSYSHLDVRRASRARVSQHPSWDEYGPRIARRRA